MYQFTEDCMVGITQIDEEHRRLFEMINETQKLLQEKHGSVASAKNLVKKLKNMHRFILHMKNSTWKRRMIRSWRCRRQSMRNFERK